MGGEGGAGEVVVAGELRLKWASSAWNLAGSLTRGRVAGVAAMIGSAKVKAARSKSDVISESASNTRALSRGLAPKSDGPLPMRSR
jgi:hypothetical protein